MDWKARHKKACAQQTGQILNATSPGSMGRPSTALRQRRRKQTRQYCQPVFSLARSSRCLNGMQDTGCRQPYPLRHNIL